MYPDFITIFITLGRVGLRLVVAMSIYLYLCPLSMQFILKPDVTLVSQDSVRSEGRPCVLEFGLYLLVVHMQSSAKPGIDLDSWYRIGTPESQRYERAECFL